MTPKPILCAAVLMLASAAQAQDLVLNETDWAVECGETACSVSRSMLQEGSTNRFASVAFAVSPGAPETQMAIFTPLGTAVQKPITVEGGGFARDLRFTTCLAEGCVVLEKLSADEFNTLSLEPALTLSFFAAEGETPVRLDLPLDGLNTAIVSAFAKMDAQ